MTKQDIIENIRDIYFRDDEFKVGNLVISSFCEEGDWFIRVDLDGDEDGEHTNWYCYLDWFDDDYRQRVDYGLPEIKPEEMYEWIAGDFVLVEE